MDRTQIEKQGEDSQPVLPLWSFLLLLGGSAVGAFGAIMMLPGWLPGLDASIQGSAPQVFWFLSRSSAGVAYILLWLSMVFGLTITNKLARVWPGGPAAVDLHQYFSLLGVAFALFHALILMGDRYIHYSLLQVLTPFASREYRPIWVGLGQISFYLMVIVTLSFYIRRRITYKVWRLIHSVSFVTYSLALMHGIRSGTDTSWVWAGRFYWLSAELLIFLIFVRLLSPIVIQTIKPLHQPD